MNQLRSMFSRSAPSVKDLTVRGQDSIVALSPTGDLLTLERDKRGAYKTQTAGGWTPGYGNNRVHQVTRSDSGRARAYAASVWAFRCINIRATKMADLMHAAQLIDRTTNEPVKTHPFLEAISWAYERYKQDVYFEYMANGLIFGEIFIEKVESVVDFNGLQIPVGPGGMRVLPSAAVEPVEQGGRIIGYEFMDQGGANVNFKLDEIAYDKYYNPASTIRGQAPMDLALEAVNVDMYVLRYSRQYYSNGARPGLVFTPKELDLTETDMESIRHEIKTQVKGVDNFFRPMFLNYAMDATLYPAQDLEDQSYLTADQRERIAAAFSVPVALVTFADQRDPQLREGFYEETVLPDVNHAIRFFNVHVKPYFDPNDEVILRANMANITALLPLLDRKRTMLELDPDEGGDFYSFPAGRTYVKRDDIDLLGNAMALPTVLPSGQQVGGERDRKNPPPQTSAPANEHINRDPNKSAEGLSPQEDMADEVRAWKKKAMRHGAEKAIDFVCYHIPDAISDLIVDGLKAGRKVPDVFAVAERMIEAEKALQATRLMFEVDFEQLLFAARQDGITRREWSNRLRTLIRKYGESAYRDGLEAGGVIYAPGEALPSDDRKIVNLMVSQASPHVTELGNTLFNKDGITDPQSALKPAQWWGTTIVPFYDAGLRSSGMDPMMEFVGNDGAESCSDCQRLKGQRHRHSDWVEKGYAPPYGDNLDCSGGGLCEHYLRPVSATERGNW
jgi:phage portal protein BeeE